MSCNVASRIDASGVASGSPRLALISAETRGEVQKRNGCGVPIVSQQVSVIRRDRELEPSKLLISISTPDPVVLPDTMLLVRLTLLEAFGVNSASKRCQIA